MAVSVERAMSMIRAVHTHAVSLNIVVTAAVVDEAGRVIALGRMDRARAMTLELAVDKAFTAANFRGPTRDLAPVAGESWFHSLAVLNQGKVMAGGGAHPIADGDRVIGAIAVAGGTEQQEEECCQLALKL